MEEKKEFPSVIDGADVVLVALLKGNDSATESIGKRVAEGSTSRPSALAITIYKGGPGVYLFYCDGNWEVMKFSTHDTMSSARIQGEGEFTELRGHWIVSPLLTERAGTLIRTRKKWSATGNAEFPYRLAEGGIEWVIRVNDFPEYPTVYSLVVDGQTICDLESLPKLWELPKTPPVLSTEYVTECPLCGRTAGWNGASYRGRNNWLYLEMDCPHCGNKFDSYVHDHQQRLERNGHTVSR